ncbi:hypothetical protein Back11_44740 [Paenibacillus baekrokdamisoli]|uniref:Uncharacterized protein n=1 Tax=Paenibacillus baekrokdamisoli TaxID=1712516 RepID=A0A3G9JJE3_9BACL|nr:hypothetical protein Back11_44740 [Paenibacillus baekrokdamisoli]
MGRNKLLESEAVIGCLYDDSYVGAYEVYTVPGSLDRMKFRTLANGFDSFMRVQLRFFRFIIIFNFNPRDGEYGII